MDWTSEQIQRLRGLWAEGHSTAEIARRMRISKNAAVGKAHRLDLPVRKSPIKRKSPSKEFVPPPESIPRVRAPDDRRFSAEEDAVILRYPDAAPRWLACILVDRNPAQIWHRRSKLRERRALEARQPVMHAPMVRAAPKTVIVAPPPTPTQPVILRVARGQCSWLDGERAPYRQCETPAIVGPEGCVWCATHRRRVYVRRSEVAA